MNASGPNHRPGRRMVATNRFFWSPMSPTKSAIRLGVDTRKRKIRALDGTFRISFENCLKKQGLMNKDSLESFLV
jgi:hypothetical protein